MDANQRLLELERRELQLVAQPKTNTAPLRWTAVGVSAAAAIIAAAIVSSQIILAVGLLVVSLAAGLASIITVAVVKRQNLPIQVRFGDSTIGVHVDASSYVPEVRHRITASIAEFALECLKQGCAPEWRRPAQPAASVTRPVSTSLPVQLESEVEDPTPSLNDGLCRSCNRRQATTQSANGNPICGICKRLVSGESRQLQTAHIEE